MKDFKIFLKNKIIKAKKKAQIRYQYFTEEEKEKKRQYYCKRRNLSKEQKPKLVEYRRNYYITHNK